MQNQKIAFPRFVTVVSIVIVFLAIVFIVGKNNAWFKPASLVASFEECVAAGNPVMESYPRQCRAGGQTFREELGTITYANATANDIAVELPFPGAVTGKRFSVIGKARGNWFFEGSFPVKVVSAKDALLATAVAQASGDWMTTDFVVFKADIIIPESFIGPAKLILQKDNPSDMRELDASISFPITIEY